jgi:hypothetical protein
MDTGILLQRSTDDPEWDDYKMIMNLKIAEDYEKLFGQGNLAVLGHIENMSWSGASPLQIIQSLQSIERSGILKYHYFIDDYIRIIKALYRLS